MKFKIMPLVLILSIIMMGCSLPQTLPTFKEQTQTTQDVTQTPKFLHPAYVIESNVKKWGYIDNNGKFVIKPTYDSASDFQPNGLAIVSIKDSYGLIDKNNKIVLEPVYGYINEYSNGFATATKNGKTYILDEKGHILSDTKYSVYNFVDGLAVFWEGDKHGYLDTSSKVVIPPNFKYASTFNNGKAVVTTLDGKYAIIDKTGTIITKLNYENVRDLSDDTAIYTIEYANKRKSGYISLTGDVLIEAKYSEANPFIDGLAIVNVFDDFEPGFGLINKKGEFVIPPQYASISSLGEGLYAVAKKSLVPYQDTYSQKAIFDKTGKQLTDFKYYTINLLPENLISVSTDTSTFLIDKKGEMVKSFTPVDALGSFKVQDGILKGELDDDIMYLTMDGKIIWQPDNTITLDNGIKVKHVKHRADMLKLTHYPEISGLTNKSVQGELNKTFKQKFEEHISGFADEEEGELAQSVSEDFTADKNKDLLIVQKNGYLYPLGAAHGMPSWVNYHININSGKFYSLGDLFKKDSGYLKKLSDIIRKQMEDKKNKEDYSYLVEKIDDITNDRGFLITKDCLQIYYEPYEIDCYAAGFPTFDIPYGEITDTIDTESEFWKSFDKNVTKTPAKETTPVSDVVKANIQESLKAYETNMIEAINQNDFSLVEPYLYEASNLYNSQKKLVTSLNNQGIKEKLDGFTVEDMKESGGVYKVFVKESVGIQYSGKDFVTKQFSWVYTVKLSQDKYLLSDIEKWGK